MENTKSEMKELLEYSEKKCDSDKLFKQIGDRLFFVDTDGTLEFWDPKDYERYRQPGKLVVSSLDAMITFITENKDGLKEEDLYIQILDCINVVVYLKAGGPENDRTPVVLANGKISNEFSFGQWMGQDEFIIGLSTLFADTQELQFFIAGCSNMRIESTDRETDDGNTTKTVSRRGVVNDADNTPDSVVTLNPFRTFRNLGQPGSAFVFRYKAEGDRVQFKLIPADGGSWKYAAVKMIEGYLRSALPKMVILA